MVSLELRAIQQENMLQQRQSRNNGDGAAAATAEMEQQSFLGTGRERAVMVNCG